METTVMPIIASLIYFAVTIYKKIFTEEKHLRWIPAIAGLGGLAIGMAMFFLTPELMVCESVFHAALIGGVSGLSAVGINQIFKQSTKTAIDNATKTDDNTKAE